MPRRRTRGSVVKVRLLCDRIGHNTGLQTSGQIIECSHEEAVRLVGAGQAEYVKETADDDTQRETASEDV